MDLRRTMAALALLALVPAAAAYDDHDWQFKLELQGGGALGGGFDARVQETLSFGDGMGEFYEQETIAAVGWKAAAWLKLGLGYGEIQCRKNAPRFAENADDGAPAYAAADHYWIREARPQAEATLLRTVGGWKLADRNRFEWRDKEGQAPYLRYRNRLQATAPWQWTAWKIAPVASVEVNVEDSDRLASSDRLNRTRWLAGLELKPRKNLKLAPALFYERNKKDGAWTDLFTLQLGAALDF